MQGKVFNAQDYIPSQGGGAHPVGNGFDAQITNTFAKATKDQTGGIFHVEFTTQAGKIEKRYNLWNQSAQAVEIANKELSALCYAVGIFKITFPDAPNGQPDLENAGRELRGARCKIDVVQQVDKDTKQPNGYVEVKKVLDIQGNEPGRPANAAPQPQQAPQQSPNPPMQQNPQGGWGNGQQANAPAWGNGQQPQPNAAAQPANTGGWQQGTAQSNPPWGGR